MRQDLDTERVVHRNQLFHRHPTSLFHVSLEERHGQRSFTRAFLRYTHIHTLFHLLYHFKILVDRVIALDLAKPVSQIELPGQSGSHQLEQMTLHRARRSFSLELPDNV